MDFWFRLPLRTRLGIIATVFLAVAVTSFVVWTMSDPLQRKPLYSFIKFAPILFLLWIAWADLKSIPFWVYLIALPILVLCALKPAALFLIVPLALVALFVMPKKKRR